MLINARQDMVIAAYALYTLWENAEADERARFQQIIKEYITRNPLAQDDFEEALSVRKELAPLRVFFQQPLPSDLAQSTSSPRADMQALGVPKSTHVLKTPMPAHHLYRIAAMESRTPWAEAIASVTAWQYGDDRLRNDIEYDIKKRYQANPSFVHLLNEATKTIEQSRQSHPGPVFQIALPPI